MFSSFFLGANSGSGFYSFYDELINLQNANAVYILKGGPGSGKSSLMRTLVSKADELNTPYELIFCSSDPNSLDGVVFPTLKVAVVDGTSPHIVEPNFPIAVERYINLGEFADAERIHERTSDIIEAKNTYSDYFTHIYRMTACAEKLDDEIFDKALGAIGSAYLRKKASGIISREIKGSGDGASCKRRFCEAISPQGYISLLSEKSATTSHTYILEDSHGIGHFLLSPIKEAALSANFACIAAYSPLKPTQILHLYIPELSLCFITSSRDIPLSCDYYRKLRLDAAVDRTLPSRERTELRRLRKLRRSFIDEACNILKDAKLVHDKLEDIYNPYISFNGIYHTAEKLAGEIFQIK